MEQLGCSAHVQEGERNRGSSPVAWGGPGRQREAAQRARGEEAFFQKQRVGLGAQFSPITLSRRLFVLLHLRCEEGVVFWTTFLCP